MFTELHFEKSTPNTHTESLSKLNEKIKGTTETVLIERSELLHRLHGRRARNEAGQEAVIDEQCPKCRHPQLSYRTAQLRGVDEGQTIFYTCLNPACKHKYTVNS